MINYYCPNEDLFSYSSLSVDDKDKKDYTEEGWLKLTPEQVEGLNNHTMCWEGNTVIPYTKTNADLKAESDNEKAQRIYFLKEQLAKTDYQAIKYAEGYLTESEYLPMKLQRQSWRDEINELEEEIN